MSFTGGLKVAAEQRSAFHGPEQSMSSMSFRSSFLMTNESNPHPHPAVHDGINAPEQKPIPPRRAVFGAVILLLVAVLLAGLGILRRRAADTVLADQTNQMAPPTVVVAPPAQGAPVDNFVLPGNVSALTDSPIYARASGYLTRWYFDIGARVKKGALLAEIATPELDKQLAQAEADLNTAEANANNAHIQADRYTGLVKSDAVSRQDTDTFVNQAAATAAAVKSAQANVQRLRELQSFEKVYAPFDGVVTARNIDTGQLIDQGAAKELFHLQAIQTLRVYTNVPQAYSPSIKAGSKIDVTFVEHPGKIYQGTLTRTADAIDPATRTLLVEIDVDNRAGQLLPGSLAQVHFKTPSAVSTFIVPAAALIFRREGMRVGTVVNGNVAHLVPVVIGEDDGAKVQIVSGLGVEDRVIQDPPDSLIEGERVSVVNSGKPTDAGAK
jgi:RND family efflux transporter MFP subunit